MERKSILHMFTPGIQMSPFDVNMAVDAGYDVVVPYGGVGADAIVGMTQDAIFSRGPKGVALTGIFIGGRDVVLAHDMLRAARKAMVPPFEVSVFADPSGSFTTAAALVACVEHELKKRGAGLAGQQVLILGGTGAVGRVAGVLAAQSGATVRLGSHREAARAQQACDEMAQRFPVTLTGVAAGDAASLHRELANATVVLACAAAGVRVLSAADLAKAPQLAVVADVNAVPPLGIEGVDVMDLGKPVPGTQAVGLGALAIGDVKYQTQHRLFVRMRESKMPVDFGVAESFAMAREVLAEAK